MNELEKKVIEIISESPGLRSGEIALKLNCERSEVNAVLYGTLRNCCHQDSSYRWYILKKDSEGISDITPDKKLSDLCKYYLNCISLEESNEVSAFLSSRSSLNYAELSDLSVSGYETNVARLIHKASAERNLTAYVGYPVLIEKIYSTRTNQSYLKIAPVFLFPVEISGGSVSVEKIPRINMEVIKQYSSGESDAKIYDLIDLERELGLDVPDSEIPVDELVARLQSIREWSWMEPLNPNTITTDPPINTLSEEGVYNKAVFIISEKPPYTAGLETELNQLSKLSEDSYKETALYDWLHGNTEAIPNNTADDVPLLEVLPFNSEQEQAIRNSLTDKITIVTGPPGTGKSQVVTNLIVNAAWNGKTVLFTSKNNKAVDVVETRVNALANSPIMLRLGGNQYANRLAELVSGLLSCSSNENDRKEYDRLLSLYQKRLQEYNDQKERKNHLIALRNRADRMERQVCDLRDRWGKWFFQLTETDVVECEAVTKQYFLTYNDWYNTKNSLLGKLFWCLLKKKKTSRLDEALHDLNDVFQKYELPILAENCVSLSPNANTNISNAGRELKSTLRAILEYREAYEDLISVPQFEDHDRALAETKEALSRIAVELWAKWLSIRHLNMDRACRNDMHEYVSAMQLINGEEVSNRPEIQRKFKRLQEQASSFLPCWAITSLSARGRIPFQPALFDLVIIDEASQCDIASALPMLYRAKRAVILGDPKQLSHISTISKQQDLGLLQKFDANLGWSYSAVSLYDLSSSLVSPEQIVHLKDHHRSFGDIIEFSNMHFYEGTLRIATNYDSLKCPVDNSAGIRWVDVEGQTVRPPSGGAYNDAEVTEILKELRRLVIENEYHGSIGVVTPFRAQAERIRNALAQDTTLQYALLKNNFLVDTVHKFQGDERDVMIFSPVISKGTRPGSIGFLKSTGNLFNVAITRARAVLIVVGDSQFCETCTVPYMEKFVEHVRKTAQKKESELSITAEGHSDRSYPKVANPEQVSDWERFFYTALFDQGIFTIPQYSEDKYKLDLAIVDGKRKLDIEIDGEMYHKNWTGELCYRDQLRNQRLFELGWDVKRFWVYQIRDDLQNCIDQIKDWIAKESI